MKLYYQGVIKYILCVVLCLFICANTVPFEPTGNVYVPRVINGWPAKLGEAPYQVALKYLVDGETLYGTFCGGVIVAPKKLITAAHCIADNSVPKFQRTGFIGKSMLSDKYAVAGNLNNRDWFSNEDTERGGQWRVLHKAYYPTTFVFPKDDIAFALTRKRFYFNEYVAPIPIASVDIEYYGPCLVSGYGRTSRGDLDNHIPGNKSSYLLLAYMDILSTSTCNKVHRRNMKLFVCSDTKLGDVAEGDSGGPLVCSNTSDPNEGEKGLLVGITSGHRFSMGSFFTRVSRYKYFIETGKKRSISNKSYRQCYTCNIAPLMISLIAILKE